VNDEIDGPVLQVQPRPRKPCSLRRHVTGTAGR
jgi:hypothetical protein